MVDASSGDGSAIGQMDVVGGACAQAGGVGASLGRGHEFLARNGRRSEPNGDWRCEAEDAAATDADGEDRPGQQGDGSDTAERSQSGEVG